MEIRDYFLKDSNVKYIESPTHSGEFKAGDLDTIVIHYTASPNARSAIRTLTSPNRNASAHLVIDRDGTITQLVPFNIIAWHAGRSSFNGRTGMNNYSIGIELVNVGFLNKSGNIYRSVYGAEIPAEDVVHARHRNPGVNHRFWQAYTPEQIDALKDVCQLIIDEYNIKFILGHEEISPVRKVDPGPAFPLDRIRDQLLDGNRDIDAGELVESGRVMVRKLNIRSGPSIRAELASRPITKGTKVDILAESNGWYKVNVVHEIEGWVAGKFLEGEN